jgi:hypothetical protein
MAKFEESLSSLEFFGRHDQMIPRSAILTQTQSAPTNVFSDNDEE